MVVGYLPGDPYFEPVLYHETGHYHSRGGPLWLREGGANFLEAYIFHATENASLQSRFEETEQEIARRCTPNEWSNIFQWQSNRGTRDCAYPLGERLLLAFYNNLGHEMVASSLRELHFNKYELFYPRESAEEAIYQVFLSNTPPERQEDFNALYKLFHGRPEPVPTEPEPVPTAICGETTKPPENPPDIPQAIVLEAFFNSTDGPNWVNNANWATDAPLDQWYGIQVDGDGRVIGIDMHENGITGVLPPELAALTHLRVLQLDFNGLEGPIPPGLGGLTRLRTLGLSENRLSGPIPPELANLSNLVHLRLGDNQLTGSIPSSLCQLSQLRRLTLRGNGFTGSIPPELGLLTTLESIHIGHNQLSGCIPNALANVPTNDLYLLEALPFCSEASVGSVELAGDAAGDRAALIALYNATDGPNWANNANWVTDAPLDQWHGVWLTDAGRVGGLGLESNLLTGPIPPELGNLTELRHLYLTYSLLTGPIPPELGNLGNLTHLGLDGNRLTGPIPGELGNLASLEYLHMRENEFTGAIPPELARLQDLASLDLAWNQLSGPIPASWATWPAWNTCNFRTTG